MAFSAFDPLTFLTILLLTFALFLLITGAFTAYFGSGKSRKIGVGLLIGGLVVGLAWGWYSGPAAHTTKPVIGVPVSGKLNLDAILSVSQMPPGVPVAAVGLDRGENAAILAVEMLALHDERLAEKLKDHRDAMKKWVLEDSRTLGE